MNQSLVKTTLIIIADDLTGAADSAARTHAAGLPTTIQPQANTKLPTRADTSAICISTNSRHLSPIAAAQAMQHAITSLSAPGSGTLYNQPLILYNKIDSTLRGNIAPEIESMLMNIRFPKVNRRPVILICPAFPAQRRGLLNGELIRWTRETRHAGPNLLDVLRRQSALKIAHITLPQVRRGTAHLRRRIQQIQKSGAQILAADGLCETDLETIVAATHGLPEVILCGSAGLVGPLAKKIAHPTPAHPDTNQPHNHADDNQREHAGNRRVNSAQQFLPPGLIWIIVGSGSATAHQQIETARAWGIPCYDVLNSPPSWPTLTAQPAPVRLLHLPRPKDSVPLEGEAARTFAARLAETAQTGTDFETPAVVVVVGGDTAEQLLGRFMPGPLAVVAEVQPGMPLVRALERHADAGPSSRPYPEYAVIKAGNHGNRDSLVELVEWIRTRQSTSRESA